MPKARANGIEIEYESFGRESDPAVLFIMGFAAQLTIWPDSLYTGLAAKGYRVIRYDNRDIGKSTHLTEKGTPDAAALMAKRRAGEKIEVPYRLEDMAKDGAELLTALGIDKAHIVGASMGGMIAQLVAIHHPAKTKSLISIMSTTGRRGLPDAKPGAMAALITPPKSGKPEDLIENIMIIRRALAGNGKPFDEAATLRLATRDANRVPYDPAGIGRHWAAIIAAEPRNELLRGVRAPAMVLHGADDPLLTVEHGKDTADSIPGSQFVAVPGLGHECVDAWVPEYLGPIAAFIDKVEGRA